MLSILISVPGAKGGSVILSDTSFTSLTDHVNDLTLRGVKDMGFTNMTQIQAKAIPPLLEGLLSLFIHPVMGS